MLLQMFIACILNGNKQTNDGDSEMRRKRERKSKKSIKASRNSLEVYEMFQINNSI
jgi:hypothetical protein